MCGRSPSDIQHSLQSAHRSFFKKDGILLTHAEKNKLNGAVTEMILSSLRPYEYANDPFLHKLIATAMEVGANHKSGAFPVVLEGNNKLISGDGVRKNLDKTYAEVTG